MKKRLFKAGLCIIAGLCGAVFLPAHAATVQTVDRPVIETESKIISSWADLYREYDGKSILPPLPDTEPLTVFDMIQIGNWSFMSDIKWFYEESGGTYYVSPNSKELQGLALPLTIRIYDYLPTGEVYILSSKDGVKFKSEAAFKSGGLTGSEFSELTDKERASRLLFQFWKKRCVWEITLKDESERVKDMLENTRSTTASAESEAGGFGMMRLSAPPEYTNGLWLCLEPQNEGGLQLQIFAPETISNIEVYACANLVSNVWTIAAQNLHPAGPTNPAVWDATGYEVFFLACGNMDIESDGDGLPDARERIVYHTDPNAADTDGDGYTDDWEAAHGMDPLSAGLNPQEDSDSDGYLNVYEYANGGDPANSNSIPPATRYVSLTGSHTPPFTSWADASTNIQAALDAATNQYEIIAAADGTYTEFMNHILVFPTNPVMLTGVSSASNCVLDAAGGYSSGLEVGASSSSNGWSVWRNITFKHGVRDGGVFVCDGSRLLIDGCALLGNYGGGMWSPEFLVQNGSRVIMRNTDVDSLDSFMGIASGSVVTMERCEVIYGNNTGISVDGDSALLGASSVIRCAARQAEYSTGAYAQGAARIEGFLFEGNERGIKCNAFSGPQVKNCVFADNVSAVAIPSEAYPSVEYCTLTGNTNALVSEAGDPGFEQGVNVRDSIIRGNSTAVNTSAAPLTVSVSNSCVQSGLPVDGNITNAPQFEYVWHLATNSPCRNAGTVAGAPAKDADGDVRADGMPDIGADEYTDRDGDGLRDWAEINVYGTNPNSTDSDSDGIPDGWEPVHGLNPLINDASEDPDSDGLTNAQEYTAGTDPHNADTDGDGLPDGTDADPLVADTAPPVFTISYPTNGTTIF